jgi:ADP-heptose:LPS heptosyltransferase
VLIIRRRALGDALVSLPLVHRLCDALPAAEIDLLIDRPFAELVARGAGRARVLAWPPPPELAPQGWLRFLRGRRYDLVIDVLSTPRTALWTALSGARLRVGYDLRWRRWAYNLPVPRNREGKTALGQFAGEGFLDLARRLTLPVAPWRPGEPPHIPVDSLGQAHRLWAEAWSAGAAPRIGLALGATWPAKAWPAREAARLIVALRDAGRVPLLLPGPGDEALTAALRAELPDAPVAPPTDLMQLADLLGRLDLLVCTDNGARHLAALMDTPTVTLYGPTDPRGWNQEHPLHVGLSRPVDCAPCDLKVCPVPGHPCLDGLTAETVLEVVETVLSRHTAPGRHKDADERSEHATH